MNESWEGFGERMKRLNPLFELGRGMEVGELKPYLQAVLMQVLLTIFYRELNDDDGRRKSDILHMVDDTIKQFNLTADTRQVERIANGLLYQGREEYSKPFESLYFDEVRKTSSLGKFVVRQLVFSRQNGYFQELYISPELSPYVMDIHLLRDVGERINTCASASDIVAWVDLEFETREQQMSLLKKVVEEIYPIVKTK